MCEEEGTLCFLNSTTRGSLSVSLIPHPAYCSSLLSPCHPGSVSNTFISFNHFLNQVIFSLVLQLRAVKYHRFITCHRKELSVGQKNVIWLLVIGLCWVTSAPGNFTQI